MNASTTPELSLVVLSWNTEELTRACLDALDQLRGPESIDFEVVVIDNASEDGSVAMIAAEFPWVRLYRNEDNLGYAGGVNQGLSLARGRYVGLLGSDTELRPGTLERCLSFLGEHPEVGAVSPRCVNPDGSEQRGCMRFPDLKTALFYDTPLERWKPEHPVLRTYFYRDWDHENDRRVDQPPGTCLIVRREVVDQVGPMDRRLWLLFNDVDWCRRISKAGWEIWYLHDGCEVLHHKGGSTSRFQAFPVEWHRNRLHYYRKHFHLFGSALIKVIIAYVGVREVLRIRRNLEDRREFVAHASQLMKAVGGVLLS